MTVRWNLRASDASKQHQSCIKAAPKQHQSYLKQVFVLLGGGESHHISHSLSLVPSDGESCQHKEHAVFSSPSLRGDHYLPQHKKHPSSFALCFHAFGFRNGELRAATHIF